MVLLVAVAYGAFKLPPALAVFGTTWVLVAIAIPWLWGIAVNGVVHETAAAIADLAEHGAAGAHHAHRIEKALAAGSTHVVRGVGGEDTPAAGPAARTSAPVTGRGDLPRVTLAGRA